MRQRLERFINHGITELVIGVLILCSVGLMILEVSFSPGTPKRELFATLGQAITWLFVIELLLRWYVASSSRRFFAQYWLDILAVLPVIRPLRILRVLRLLRLPRLCVMVARRTRRVLVIFNEGMTENLLILVILVIVCLIGAIGIRVVEPMNQGIQSFSDAIWWSIYTLMAGQPTLGEPQTGPGRMVTMVVMLGGFTIFAMFTGVVSAVMVSRLRVDMIAKDMELEELVDHIVICGWNRAAFSIIRELQSATETRTKAIVLVAELEEEPRLPPEVDPGRIFFVREDFTSTEVLRRVRVQHATSAVLLADKSRPRSDEDRDSRTILAALTIEQMPKPEQPEFTKKQQNKGGIYTCVELLKRTKHKVWVLQQAGVEDVVEGDEYVGNLIAQSTRNTGLIQVIDELLTANKGSEFEQIILPPGEEENDFGRLLRRYKEKEDKLLLAIISQNINQASISGPKLNPPYTEKIYPGARLLVVTHPDPRINSPLPRRVPAFLSPNAESGGDSLKTVYGHYLICGWNRSGEKIIRQLRASPETKKIPVVIIAHTPPEEWKQLEEEYSDLFFLAGDFVSIKVLQDAGVKRARIAILLADKSLPRSDQDRDSRTILAALTIEKMRHGIHSCVELLNRDREKVKILRQAGVDDIIVGDEYIGNLIAHSLRSSGLAQSIDELLTSERGNEFFKIPVPADLAGKDFLDILLALKQQQNALVVAVETEDPPDGSAAIEEKDEKPQASEKNRCYVTNPPATMKIRPSDQLFIIKKPKERDNV